MDINSLIRLRTGIAQEIQRYYKDTHLHVRFLNNVFWPILFRIRHIASGQLNQ